MINDRPAPHMDMRDMTDEEIDRMLADAPRRSRGPVMMAGAIAVLAFLALGLAVMGGVS